MFEKILRIRSVVRIKCNADARAQHDRMALQFHLLRKFLQYGFCETVDWILSFQSIE